MPAMPEQNPLPLPEPAPADSPTPPAPIRPEPRRARPGKPPLWARLMGRLAEPWLGLNIEPGSPAELIDERPVCYVLEDYGLSNALILEKACRETGLPSPLAPLPGDPLGRKRAYVALSRRNQTLTQLMSGSLAGVTGEPQPIKKSHSESLARLLQAHRTDPALDVQLVPVSIFVGRAPNQASGWFSVLFSENWAIVGRFRRLLAILLNGRDTIVRFSAPVSLRESVEEGLEPERTVRKLSRVLRTHFNRIREAVIGPDLSTRRVLVDQVLASESVKEAIAEQARRDKSKPEDAWKKAHAYAWEIAADYSNPVVRSASFLLSHVWNRIYAGVLVHHLDRLKEAAPGHEVVYVPSHRSHMDYLLLSYLLYERGIVPPHIFAGVNLNLPVVGTLLRKGGAFFARRSFRGNALYSAVFSEYMAQLVAGGYSIEYFIEGGRSRTGRLLQPKTGMLSMTLRSYLRDPRRPVVFLPVYFGYERLVEGKTYIGELSGAPKQKESVIGILRTLPALRKRFGKVHVSFGEPVHLDEVLDVHAPGRQRGVPEKSERPSWLAPAVDDLATRIMTNINSAACATPINLLALALLAMPKQAMLESDLARQLELYASLLRQASYSPLVWITGMDGASMIRHGERMGVLQRLKHPLGDVMKMTEENSVLMTYFRNNVLHLIALPSLIACCFLNNRTMSTQDIQRLMWRTYPYVRDELFLRWSEQDIAATVREVLDDLANHGLIEALEDGAHWRRPATGSSEAVQLSVLAQTTVQIVERYYLVIAVLLKSGSGRINQDVLESQCQLMAQRISLLQELNSPEFFDKVLFKSFIDLLRARNVVSVNAEGRLVFTETLEQVAGDAQLVLHEQIRNSVLQATHG